MKRDVCIWADADTRIGYGHFVRSLALAEMLKEEFNCTFFTQSPTQHQRDEVEKVCSLIPLPSDNSKFDLFLKHLTGHEIVVLDNYFFTSDYQRLVKEKGCKLVCIGTNDRHYYSDIVINYILSPELFSSESYTRFCVGFEWILLRKPFLKTKTSVRSKTGKSNIVICFGGTDQFLLTEKTIDIVRSVDPSLSVDVISTDAIGAERINGLINHSVKVHINASAEEIAALFTHSFISIVSASTTALEALACTGRVVYGYYVGNQIHLYEYLKHHSFGVGIGNLMEGSSEKLLVDLLKSEHVEHPFLKSLDSGTIQKNYVDLFSSL